MEFLVLLLLRFCGLVELHYDLNFAFLVLFLVIHQGSVLLVVRFHRHIYTCLNFSMTRIESLSCFGNASFFHLPQKLENACRNGCEERLFMMQICAMGATASVEMLQKLRDGMLSLIMPRIPAQYVCQQCHFPLACSHQL
jgi:hypothetical protein